MNKSAALTSVVLLLAVGCSRSGPVVAQLQRTAPAPPAAEAAAGQVAKDDAAARKIKYTADVRVICDDFDKAHDGFTVAVKQHKGLIAHSEITGSPGSVRVGQWRVRVAVARFDDFRSAVLKLGEVEKDTSDSEDVTEEYYDLEAHIKNRQAEEESLRKLLEKSGDKIENILAVRKELAQVRDDINRKQGRLKLLANLTDLTTVNVTIREKQRFNAGPPPAVAEVPTFGMRVRRTFTSSIDALTAFVQDLALVAIALAPWALLAAVVLGPIYLVARRLARRRAAATAGPGAT
jgi:hypothetical protein